MKIMMLITMFFSIAAHAEMRVSSFDVDTRTAWGDRVYYNCDAVENFTEEMLEDLGATNIDVRCTGGIDVHNPRFSTRARVTAYYQAVSEGEEMVRMTLKGRDRCHLANEIFAGIEGGFVIDNVVTRRCMRSHSRYNIRFNILK